MAKKQILVAFTGAMNTGGVERSLLGLLDALDYDNYDVDVFLYAHHGDLFSMLNKNANLLDEVNELAYLRESFLRKIMHGTFYAAYRRIVDNKKLTNDQSWQKVLNYKVEKLSKKYDLALGFFLPFDLIRDKVDAKVKIGWIHTDYSNDMERYALNLMLESYSGVDYIAAVSPACKERFVAVLPELADKTIVVENILPKELIKKQAIMPITDLNAQTPGQFCLLSIGRFSPAKNFNNVPDICKKIRDKGLNIKWYLIGYGGDEALIRQKIDEADMNEYVIVLGKKENPYPYIVACDLYVQPSRYEGKCVAVREAQMIGKPVVITNYATSSSQLENGVDGIIVPMDNESCAEGIASLLRSPKKMEQLSQTCLQRDYSNSQEIEKLYELIVK